MLGHIEQVHGARQVEITIRVELTGEFCCVRLEIGFYLEVDTERVTGLALLCNPLATETLLPLAR